MLKRRLIPKLQMKSSSHVAGQLVLVTTVNFDRVIEIGDPVSQAKIYEAQAADELIFVDLDATREGRLTDVKNVRRAAEEIFMPITVGGGVRTVEDFRYLLSNGADKVTVNTAALKNTKLLTDASRMFGSQCVVLSIDYKKVSNGVYEVWSNGGTVNTHRDVTEWALEGERLGAGEILLTSIDRDGSRSGIDIECTKNVVSSVSIPVITSGGCGLARHFVEGFKEGGANAVCAGTYFSFKDENPMQCRAQIKNAGIPIRLHK